MQLWLLLVATITIIFNRSDANQLKVYKVNLDAEPEKRWDEVIIDHLQYVPEIKKEISNYFNYPFGGVLCWLAEKVSSSFSKDYIQELTGISKISGIDYCHVVGMNILYDITNYNALISTGMGCTSLVVENSDGKIYHGRNLDYIMTDLMKNLSIIVDFTRNGKIIYSALTFAFFNGVSTGQRPNAFTLSLNARRTGWYFYTILMQIYTGLQLPVGYALRNTLEESSNYCDALDYLSKVHFVAPLYLILAGTETGEGALITRDRWSAANIIKLKPAKNQWFFVQTNFDHWDPDEDHRRTTAENVLNKTDQSSVTEKFILDVMETEPVMNRLTITKTVMSAAEPELFYKTERRPTIEKIPKL